MVFSSAVFLWIFLPIVFAVNYVIQSRYSNIFLLIASLIFYAWGEPVLVFLMFFSIVINWLLGIGITRFRKNKKIFLILGIFFNLMILGYYKYLGFIAEIINFVFKNDILIISDIELPIGISFYTFQALSYLVDIYRAGTKSSEKFINTALYIAFFPQLIAGPIVKYHEIDKQIEKRDITGEKFSLGFRCFIYGLSKKVLISNILGKSADAIFATNILLIDGKIAWLGAILYTFQIYYDFSGYSDMAIGLGKMFGFDIPENFNYPYLAKSVGEFWRRWHISLGSWFKDYLYIPLGGNRHGISRTFLNLIIVFFLTGLWHGASFNYIMWGLYYGIFSILERLGLEKILKKYGLGSIYLFLVVTFGWIMFRITNINYVFMYLYKMLIPWKYINQNISIWNYVNGMTIFILIIAILGMGVMQKSLQGIVLKLKYTFLEVAYNVCLLVLCISAMASNAYNPFIYFQF